MDEGTKPSKFSAELKQTAKGEWYVGSLKVNAESVEEMDTLLAQGAAKIRQRLAVLNGETPEPTTAPQPKPAPTRVETEEPPFTPEEQKLYENLRQFRRLMAQQEGVPPYILFHDSMLKKMAREKPREKSSLTALIGEKRFEKYGEMILELIERQKGEG